MQTISPKLDSLAAWNTATRLVSANREMLLAIAGVFFMLPGIVLSLMVTEPELQPDATPEQMWPVLQQFYIAALPWLIPSVLLSMSGTLALQLVMGDPARPTVATAIRRGFALMPSFLAAQLLYGMALGLGLTVMSGLAALSGNPAVVGAVILAAVPAVLYFSIRLLLIPAVLAAENVRGPVRLLRRSWALTRGQTGRLAVFVLLAALVFTLISGLIAGLIAVILTFVAGESVQLVLNAAVSSGFSAVGLLYFAAIQVAVHRQFAGPTPSETAATFE